MAAIKANKIICLTVYLKNKIRVIINFTESDLQKLISIFAEKAISAYHTACMDNFLICPSEEKQIHVSTVKALTKLQ